jgi:hypothetical protein
MACAVAGAGDVPLWARAMLPRSNGLNDET